MKKLWILGLLFSVPVYAVEVEDNDSVYDDAQDGSQEKDNDTTGSIEGRRSSDYESGSQPSTGGRTTSSTPTEIARAPGIKPVVNRGPAGGNQVAKPAANTGWVPPVVPRSDPAVDIAFVQQNQAVIKQIEGLEKQLDALQTIKSNIEIPKNAFFQKLMNFLKGNGWKFPDHPMQYIEQLNTIRETIADTLITVYQKVNISGGTYTSQDLLTIQTLVSVLKIEQRNLQLLEDNIESAPNAQHYNIEAAKKEITIVLGDIKDDINNARSDIRNMQSTIANNKVNAVYTTMAAGFQPEQDVADATFLKDFTFNESSVGVDGAYFLQLPPAVRKTTLLSIVKTLMSKTSNNKALQHYVSAFKARYQNSAPVFLEWMAKNIQLRDTTFNQQVLAAFKQQLFTELIAYKKIPFAQQARANNIFASGTL